MLGAASAVGSGGALDAPSTRPSLPYTFGCVGCLLMGVVVVGLLARRRLPVAASREECSSAACR